MINLSKIPAGMQPDIISSFWTMMRECESKADNDRDPILKLWVEGWYRQWNRMTGSVQQPIWMTRAAQPAIAVMDYSGSKSDLEVTPDLLKAIGKAVRHD